MSEPFNRHMYYLLLSIEAKRLWILDEPDPSDLAGKLRDIAFRYAPPVPPSSQENPE